MNEGGKERKRNSVGSARSMDNDGRASLSVRLSPRKCGGGHVNSGKGCPLIARSTSLPTTPSLNLPFLPTLNEIPPLRSNQSSSAMKVTIKEWNAVATWRWDMPDDEVCGICRVQFDGTCPTCKFPGDDCSLCMSTVLPFSHCIVINREIFTVLGKCGHSFHMVRLWILMFSS